MIEARTLRAWVKRALPPWMRRTIRAPITYLQRVGRWGIVLVQMRGVSLSDEVKLLGSALAAPFTCWRDLSHWQDPVLLADINVHVPGIGQFALRKRTDDLFHVLPYRERALIKAMRSLLRPGDMFVDAGANIGVYTVFASRLVGDSGKVVAFEMMPDTAEILLRHIDRNACSNTQMFQQALSDHAGDVFTARVSAGKHGQASIIRSDFGEGFSEVKVISTTLDASLVDGAAIRLIKMDLEGAEERAMTGAVEVLRRTHAVIFEDWTSPQQSTESGPRILRDLGFELRRIDGRNWIAVRASV